MVVNIYSKHFKIFVPLTLKKITSKEVTFGHFVVC